jgi:hypothetical protein
LHSPCISAETHGVVHQARKLKIVSAIFLCILFTEEDAAAFTGWSDALLPTLNAKGSLSKVQGNKVSCGNDFK